MIRTLTISQSQNDATAKTSLSLLVPIHSLSTQQHARNSFTNQRANFPLFCSLPNSSLSSPPFPSSLFLPFILLRSTAQPNTLTAYLALDSLIFNLTPHKPSRHRRSCLKIRNLRLLKLQKINNLFGQGWDGQGERGIERVGLC